MPVSTTDYSASALLSLLTSGGLNLKSAIGLVASLEFLGPKHGLIPVETDNVFGDVLQAPVPDTAGANPALLVLSGDNQTLDIANFSNLHAVVLEDVNVPGIMEHFTFNNIPVTGPKYITVYLR